MICPKCRTKYYSKTHCPKCGFSAFSLDKGKRVPTRTSFKYLYMVTIAAFMIAMFIALIYLNVFEKSDGDRKKSGAYQKISLIKIKGGEKKDDAQKYPDSKDTAKENVNDELIELNRLGVTAYNNGDYDKAFIYFYQAYSLDNDNEYINKNLYNTLFAKGSGQLSEKQFDDALKNFEKSLEYIDDDFAAYQGIGMAYFGLKDTDKALKYLLKANSLNERSDELKLAISKIYYNTGEFEKAKDFLDLIEDRGRFAADINTFIMLNELNTSEINGKEETGSSHFKVYYDGYHDPVAGNLVSIILEEVYFTIGRELDHYPPDKVSAILYTNEQFDENTAFPDWSGAVFDGRIKLPAGGLKNRSKKLQEILAHEFTHAAIFSKVKDNCPSWLNEGLAQKLSGKTEPRREEIVYLKKHRLIPELKALNKSFIDMRKEEAFAAYLISMLFTKSLIDSYGMNSINNYLDALSEEVGFEDAFKKTYYINLDETYKKFIDELISRY